MLLNLAHCPAQLSPKGPLNRSYYCLVQYFGLNEEHSFQAEITSGQMAEQLQCIPVKAKVTSSRVPAWMWKKQENLKMSQMIMRVFLDPGALQIQRRLFPSHRIGPYPEDKNWRVLQMRSRERVTKGGFGFWRFSSAQLRERFNADKKQLEEKPTTESVTDGYKGRTSAC